MPSPSSVVCYYLGLDLGQAHDFSALVVLETSEATPPRTYAGRHLQRWPLGASYPTVAQEVAGLAEGLALAGPTRHVTLAVDGTGVGRAVIDLLKREPMPHVELLPILITGGDVETQDKGVWHVPKRNLMGVVQVALQTQRLSSATSTSQRSMRCWSEPKRPRATERTPTWSTCATRMTW
jgi:hypothetical protein